VFRRLPSSEELLAEQCRLVKQASPHMRCLVYRNAALGLQWLSSEAAAMYGPDNETLFLHTSPAGPIYNMAGAVPWCGKMCSVALSIALSLLLSLSLPLISLLSAKGLQN
jgi:hypothetical protein